MELNVKEIQKEFPNTHEHLTEMLDRARNWNNEKAVKARLPNHQEIIKTIINYANYLEENNIDPHKITFVGIERGGRLPALLLKAITGAREIRGLSINQSGVKLNEEELQKIIDEAKNSGHHLLFIDTATEDGRQEYIIRTAMRKYGLKKGVHWGLALPNQNEPGNLNLESPTIEDLSKRIDDDKESLGFTKNDVDIIPLIESGRPSKRWKLLRRIANVTKDLGGPIKDKLNR